MNTNAMNRTESWRSLALSPAAVSALRASGSIVTPGDLGPALRKPVKPRKPSREERMRRNLNWEGKPRQKAIPGTLKAIVASLDAGTISFISAPSKLERNKWYSIARRMMVPIYVKNHRVMKKHA